MEAIFHEKQDGSLCAQHCLNALLQGPYFTPVDLSDLAHQMDEEERKRMAESGVNSIDYQRFLQQPSGNMDDSGFFSIQVVSSALAVWSLELIPFTKENRQALIAQCDLSATKAFICNYKEHWFTIRKLGNQWFNLNSLLTGPELISDTYLDIFLAQLHQEGYSIFIVNGHLPECDADSLLRITPAVQVTKPRLLTETKVTDDEELELALKKSMQDADDEEYTLNHVLEMSMRDSRGALPNQVPQTGDTSEDEDLRRALEMSLECSTATTPNKETDLQKVREMRLKYYNSQGDN